MSKGGRAKTCYFKNETMKKFKLRNLDCASCASKIESKLAQLDEVRFVTMNFANSLMTIDSDNLEKVKGRINGD